MSAISERTAASPQAVPAPKRRTGNVLGGVLKTVVRVALPILSILGLWYGAILWSGMPAFVLPRPETVVRTLIVDWALIWEHLLYTLQVAVLGFIMANVVGIGLAVLLVAVPVGRLIVMPAAITMRNIPYVVLVSVLALAMGDGIATKVMVVTLAGFFPVLVNTHRGLLAVDPIVLDRMRILDASTWEIFTKVRFPYSLPFIVAAQEITGSASIVISIAIEWMISRTGLGYLINQAMMQYRGDQVYAVALVAATISFLVYSSIHYMGERINWKESPDQKR
jgi:NitT/TauT family transport system permease protein